MAVNVPSPTPETEPGGPTTLQLYITSPCADFSRERQILRQEVLPDLRAWCEGLNLEVRCTDIRWGGYHSGEEVKGILQSIQQQYFHSQMPFFINITCESLGMIPCCGEVPDATLQEYHKLMCISSDEALLMYAAYREDNPNGLLLVRNDEFFEYIHPEERAYFVPSQRISQQSRRLAKRLFNKYKGHQRLTYEYESVGWNPDSCSMAITIHHSLTNQILEALKQRIRKDHAPAMPTEVLDIQEQMRAAHRAFMVSRSAKVRGRTRLVQKIEEHVCGRGPDVALLLLGGAGSGKSSIMAKAAHALQARAAAGDIPFSGGEGWHVFYHFVGALPGSTDLLSMLRRLLRELNIVHEPGLTRDVEAAAQLCCSVLSNPTTRPVIVMVDAVNQFDEEPAAQILSWLPRKLAPQVRCVLSMINDTAQHKTLMERETRPAELHLTPLDIQARQQIVQEQFEAGQAAKQLQPTQMRALLSKKASENPLWLCVACHELGLLDSPALLTENIHMFPDGLLDLLESVLSRLEAEAGGPLLVATVCLLEVSCAGLMEDELRHMLGRSRPLLPPSPYDEKEEMESQEKEDGCEKQKQGPLSPEQWLPVYRALRPFLRPYGDSREGRLDFYHRALSKAVRRKYLGQGDENESGEESQDLYSFWHQKLADFFENCNNLDRKAEEYLYHLSHTQDQARLGACLTDWSMMERLYNQEHSSQLLAYWRQAGGTAAMLQSYKVALAELEAQQPRDEQQLALRYEQVARIFLQAGSYSESLELTTVAIKWEEKELGNRPERMVELYSLMAEIYDEKLKLNDFVSPSQLPDLRRTISYGRMSINLRQEFVNKGSELSAETLTYHKSKLGLSLMKLAFSLESWEACGGDVEMTGEEALEEGNKHIDAAMAIFKQLQDSGHYAEALMTKGVLAKRGSSQQLEHYNKAMEICRQVYGDYSLLTSRLYINIGIVYEDNNDFVRAFEYFKKWGRVSETVLGPEHPKTLRAKGVLKEPRYCLVAARLQERETQLEEQGNDSQEGTLTLEAINQEVEHVASREAVEAFSGWSDNQQFGGEEEEEEDGDELSEHYEGEGELLHVTEELQQAINELLQNALGELEITEQLQSHAQGLIGLAEQNMQENTAPNTPTPDNNTPSQVPDSNMLAEEGQSEQSQDSLSAEEEQEVIVDSNVQTESMQEVVLDSNIMAENMINVILNSRVPSVSRQQRGVGSGVESNEHRHVDSNIEAEERDRGFVSDEQTDDGHSHHGDNG